MKIVIQEPWWSAWKTFGWAKSIWGIGFNSKEIDKAIINREQIEVSIYKSKEMFKISPVTIKNYAEKNKTMYLAKHNTNLYVIPSTELRKCNAF